MGYRLDHLSRQGSTGIARAERRLTFRLAGWFRAFLAPFTCVPTALPRPTVFAFLGGVRHDHAKNVDAALVLAAGHRDAGVLG
jgi:hypothetical protein